MARFLYAFMDGDVMFYVGQTSSLSTRLWLHKRDSKISGQRVYKRIRELEQADRPHAVKIIAELPSDRRAATILERDFIASIGLVEDGGTLLNGRRSSVRGDRAGYIDEARKRMGEAAKAWLADPENAERNREKLRAIRAREGYAEEQAALQREIWSRPGEREARLAKQHSAEVQATRAAEMKRRWADPAFKAKMAKRKPSTWTDERRASHGDKCRTTLAKRQEA